MRVVCLVITLAGVLAAQDSSSYKTVVDINGKRVEQGPEVSSTVTPGGSQTTERMRSINGRMVPLDRVEERVVRDDASGKVTERIIHHYDLTGDPGSTERVVIEEQKGANGSSTVLTSSYRTDVNGHTQLAQRTTTQNQVSGDTMTSDTVVERASINDGLEPVEKQTKVRVKQGTGYEEASMTYRKDAGGSFYPAVRQVTDHTENGSQSSDNTAEYEVGATGSLELHGQTITTTRKLGDGSQDVAVDIFSKNVPGVVNDTKNLQLQEHQTIERKVSGNQVTETLSVQRPSVSNPKSLGAPQQISETVCKGKCGQ